jgi:hypothetical protein
MVHDFFFLPLIFKGESKGVKGDRTQIPQKGKGAEKD